MANLYVGRGLAVGDLFNDGKLDVVINVLDGHPALLRNVSTDTHHWIELKLSRRAEEPARRHRSYRLPYCRRATATWRCSLRRKLRVHSRSSSPLWAWRRQHHRYCRGALAKRRKRKICNYQSRPDRNNRRRQRRKAIACSLFERSAMIALYRRGCLLRSFPLRVKEVHQVFDLVRLQNISECGHCSPAFANLMFDLFFV